MLRIQSRFRTKRRGPGRPRLDPAVKNTLSMRVRVTHKQWRWITRLVRAGYAKSASAALRRLIEISMAAERELHQGGN